MNKLFIFAGEPSGDQLGAGLIAALKSQQPAISLVGVGGPAMRLAGLDAVMKMEEFAIIGFFEVIKALPKLWKQFYRVRDLIMHHQPDAVILIDYPGLNLRLAKALRKQGYRGKIIQYVSPTVWAWAEGRKNIMAETLDLLMVIFPFEVDCFHDLALPVEYVGNPAVERIASYTYQNNWREELDIPPAEKLIAIFPGSRLGEVDNNFTRQIEAARRVKLRHPDTCFVVSCANDAVRSLLLEIINNSTFTAGEDLFIVPQQYRYELMRDSHTALATSGTVTLELALHERPTVVMYEVSKINKFIGKHLLRINLPYFCIVNILMGHEVFPELIENSLSIPDIVDSLSEMIENTKCRDRCIDDCKKMRILLGNHDSSDHAAQLILERIPYASPKEMVKT
ncbi:MAG: lipid-A-disaccharide synthase [Chlamydiales bacterium]|nr:lipid-A-disaccharide synthase [Chlamydiales bacterium]